MGTPTPTEERVGVLINTDNCDLAVPTKSQRLKENSSWKYIYSAFGEISSALKQQQQAFGCSLGELLFNPVLSSRALPMDCISVMVKCNFSVCFDIIHLFILLWLKDLKCKTTTFLEKCVSLSFLSGTNRPMSYLIFFKWKRNRSLTSKSRLQI